MDKTQILAELNKALAMEYADVFLYQRHVDHFKNYPGIGDLFKNFSQMEAKHADILSQEISRLGGNPVFNIVTIPDLRTSEEVARVHLKNETDAIKFYGKLSEAIDDNRLSDLLDKIRVEETIHAAALKQILKAQ